MVSIIIETENAAFEENAYSEIARILRDLADKIEDTDCDFKNLFDVNGNRIGKYTFDR